MSASKQASLWKVTRNDSDNALYFEDEEQAKHNFDAFSRAGLSPTIREYGLISTTYCSLSLNTVSAS